MADNPTISKITLPSGTTYDLKDAKAREDIAGIQAIIAGGVSFIGETTTALEDGSTTNPITINDQSVTATSGALVVYGSKEFIFDGTKWIEFGDLGTLKALAFKDSASGTYTPQGSISASFSGNSNTVSFTISANDNGNYTPAGSISGVTFSGSSMTSTGNFTPSGSVSFSNSNLTAAVTTADTGTATYTPSGTISGMSFSGSSMTSTGTFTPSGSISFSNSNKTATVAAAASGTATYTPGGSVDAPTISVSASGTTSTAAIALSAAAPNATAPSNAITYYAVASETLSLYQIGYTTGTFKTGDASYTATAPTFSGSAVRLVTDNISVPNTATFSGSEGSVSVSGTTTGSVSGGSFSGSAVRLVTGNISVPQSATFSGSEGSVSVSGTTAGSVSGGTFTGTKVKIEGAVTPTGTVSGTFSGSQATITVS